MNDIKAFKDWEELWAEFEALGPHGVKHHIRMQPAGFDIVKARLWLDEYEERRAGETLQVMRKAAQASAQSARFAMWAAIISLVAIIVTLLR